MTGYKCSTLYTYDALGRQSAVSSGPTSSAGLLASQYAYTLQQWSSSITTSLGGRTVFSETLGYDSPSNSLGGPSYTGLITRKNETWTIPTGPLTSQFQSVPRTEDYVYDYAARLSAWDDSSGGENISYDARDNITSRSPRYGSGGTVTLTYSGDRLATRKVGTGTAVSFAHDSFARMTTDAEAGLTITYNVLDLPERISQGTTLKVKYTYLADGTKVSALDASGAGLVYRGPFTYRRSSGGTLTFESAPFDGGRLTEAGTRYHITDHLGSVRSVINGNASMTTYPLTGFYSVDDFAPFGTKSTSSASSYLSLASTGSTVSLRDGFTGQEDQLPDFSIGYSDFGARQYSPSLSRWFVPDPMGEKYYDVSPYAYCVNNPIIIVDPEGEDILPRQLAEFLDKVPEYLYSKVLEDDFGPYSVSAYYDKDDNIVGYGAAKLVREGRDDVTRFDYILTEPSDLSLFADKANVFSVAADLFNMNNGPTPGELNILAGNISKGLSMEWSNALRNPVYWMYTATALGSSYLLSHPSPTIDMVIKESILDKKGKHGSRITTKDGRLLNDFNVLSRTYGVPIVSRNGYTSIETPDAIIGFHTSRTTGLPTLDIKFKTSRRNYKIRYKNGY